MLNGLEQSHEEASQGQAKVGGCAWVGKAWINKGDRDISKGVNQCKERNLKQI